MTAMWTDGEDYVIAQGAEQARAHVIESNGLEDQDASPMCDWKRVPDRDVWTLGDEDDPTAVENIPVCAILALHVARNIEIPMIYWSPNW